MPRRRQSVLLRLAVLVALCLAPAFATGQRVGRDEQVLFEAANRDRAAQRLKPLRWSNALAEAARTHANLLAQRNTLSHQFPGEPGLPQRAARAGARFSTVAENVAEGPSAASIHAQWMKSPPHRENLLDPNLDSVGIAVVARGGILFAAEDFSRAIEELSLDQQEKLLSAQLRSNGLQILSYTDEARRTCRLDNSYAGAHTPSFVVHYLTPDVEQLPDLLEIRIQTGRYHSAAVGACTPDRTDPGSQYRVAVMLFE